MIIDESANEKEIREDQRDDAHRASIRWSELTGKPLEYLDEFTYDPRDLARYALNRLPKCCKPRPLKPKEKK